MVFLCIWTQILVEIEQPKLNVSVEVTFTLSVQLASRNSFFFLHRFSFQINPVRVVHQPIKMVSVKVLSPIAWYYSSVGNWLIMTVADYSIIPIGVIVKRFCRIKCGRLESAMLVNFELPEWNEIFDTKRTRFWVDIILVCIRWYVTYRTQDQLGRRAEPKTRAGERKLKQFNVNRAFSLGGTTSLWTGFGILEPLIFLVSTHKYSYILCIQFEICNVDLCLGM